MPLDVELYRRSVTVPASSQAGGLRRLSVIDIRPEGATRTLVFVHGYGGRTLQWLHQLRFFGQYTRVIAPDLRGHGLSDDPAEPAASMDGLVADLALLLERLQVQQPFSLIAHSFGGAVATEYAVRYPEQVLHLVLVGVPTRFLIRPLLRRLMTIPNWLFPILARWLHIALYAQLHTLKHFHDQIMAPWRGDERIPLLTVPTLVILGHRDRVFLREHYEDVSRVLPRAQQVVIPVSAHLVQLERPDAVNRAIRRFIEHKAQNIGTDAARREVGLGILGNRSPRRFDMPWLQSYDNEVPEQMPVPGQLLFEMLSHAAHDFPHRPALVFFGQKIGYRELDLLSNRFARALRQHGIQAGERVAILLPNIPQCVIAFYGILKAGAIVVLGSPLSTAEEISAQLRDSGACTLLTLTSYRALAASLARTTELREIIYTDVREYLPLYRRVLLASLIEGPSGQQEPGNSSSLHSAEASVPGFSFQQLLRAQSAAPLESLRSANDIALLQYTSGTTDTPKGAILSHANLMVNVAQVRHWIPEARRGHEVILCALPLSHSYGITDCMNLGVALAASLVLLPTTRTDEILKAIKRSRPSLFPGIPALYLAIANYPKVRSYGVSTVRMCISGSAPLPVEVQEAFEKLTRGRLVEGYGLTEASPSTHGNPLKGERRVGSIGVPLPGTDARIVSSETGEVLPPGEVGELLIRGPQVMQGYWNMPVESAHVLSDGWLHTGDLARMDDDGFFTIVERKKDVILSGLYNIYPRDVEEVLYEHPKVLEVAVVGTRAPGESAESGEKKNSQPSPWVKAVVVLKRGEKATPDELLALCRERLDAYKVPRQIEFRAELPKNLVGKVLRRLLVES